MSPICFRRFISGIACARLRDPHLPRSKARLFPRRSPPRLLTAAARGGLRPPPAQRPRRATRPPGPAPPSLAQHRIQRLGLLHPASFNVRVRTNARDPGPTGPLATFRLAASALAPKAAVLGPATRLPVLVEAVSKRSAVGLVAAPRARHAVVIGCYSRRGVAAGPGLGLGSPGYPGTGAGPCRQSLSKLCVAVISRHSARQAPRPLRWKRSTRRLCFVWAKTGSMIACRWR